MTDVAYSLADGIEHVGRIYSEFGAVHEPQRLSSLEMERFWEVMACAEILLASSLGLTLSKFPTVFTLLLQRRSFSQV